MMKQLLLNQRKTGGRVTSLLVVLLTTLAMTLLPQRACADVTVGFTGYGNDVITGNPCNWNVVGGSNISFTADEGLGATVPVTGTTAFMVTSAFSFSGEVNSISLEMEYSEGLTIKAYYVEASGNSTNLSANNSFDYANGMYTLTLSNVASLKEHSIQLQFTTNSDNCQISKWKGITVGGNVSLNVPVTYYGITVAGVQVTSENIQEFEGVSFSDGILSLENAYYDDVLQTSLAELTIKVIGSNNHFGGIRYSGQYETSTLTFIKDEQSEGVCSLTLNGSYNEENPIEESAISGFTSVNYGEGMSLAAAYGTEYSKDLNSGYYFNSASLYDTSVEYVSQVTITSADVYQLWYNSEQVTSENAATLEKSYDDNSVTASFDGKTSTLTFNNLGGGYGGHAVISNMENLNVYLVGENSMSGESQSFFYTPSQSAKINFQTSDDTPGSLTMYYSVPFEGFVEANIIYENDLKYTLTPQYSADDPSVVENYTATIQVPPYGLIVYTAEQQNGVQVTKQNRTNVLGDQETATVQFDGRNRLVLNGATLTKILLSDSQFLPFVDEGKKLRGMEIYLEGESTIENSVPVAIQGDATTTKLTFLTGGNAPGSLTYNYTGEAVPEYTDLFPGFDVEYKDNLTKMLVSSTQVVVKCPLQLIVDDIGVPATVIYNDASYDIVLNDDIVDKVLYTLDDTGTAGSNDDGYYNGTIVINSVMTDEQVRISDGYEPGTPGYAANFK